MDDYLTSAELKGRVIEQRRLRRNPPTGSRPRQRRAGAACSCSRRSPTLASHFRILLRLSEAGTQNVQGLSEPRGANRSLVSRALPDLREKGLMSWSRARPTNARFSCA